MTEIISLCIYFGVIIIGKYVYCMFFSRFIFISSDWDGTNVIGMEMGMEMGNENRKEDRPERS